jgi:hypothetical protein
MGVLVSHQLGIPACRQMIPRSSQRQATGGSTVYAPMWLNRHDEIPVEQNPMFMLVGGAVRGPAPRRTSPPPPLPVPSCGRWIPNPRCQGPEAGLTDGWRT